MTNTTTIRNHVETRINRDRVGGYTLEQLWLGIHPDERFGIIEAIASLIDAGKIEITSKRIFFPEETVTSYRKIHTATN